MEEEEEDEVRVVVAGGSVGGGGGERYRARSNAHLGYPFNVRASLKNKVIVRKFASLIFICCLQPSNTLIMPQLQQSNFHLNFEEMDDFVLPATWYENELK